MTSENRYVLYFQVKGTCPYLSNNHSTMMNLLIFQDKVDPRLYSALISNGWRRYGKEIYRMECPGCKLCIPLRIKAESIQLTLSLNRILKKIMISLLFQIHRNSMRSISDYGSAILFGNTPYLSKTSKKTLIKTSWSHGV